jgi:hypothetical protein
MYSVFYFVSRIKSRKIMPKRNGFQKLYFTLCHFMRHTLDLYMSTCLFNTFMRSNCSTATFWKKSHGICCTALTVVPFRPTLLFPISIRRNRKVSDRGFLMAILSDLDDQAICQGTYRPATVRKILQIEGVYKNYVLRILPLWDRRP